MIMYATVGDHDAECDHAIAHVTSLPMIFPVGSGLWKGIGTGWDHLHQTTGDIGCRPTTGHREHMARLLPSGAVDSADRPVLALTSSIPALSSCEVADQGD
jgi:hypothetical protein